MENNEQLSKYLKLARTAREEDNTEDAKKYYDIVRTEDPECAEAKFFYSYYALYEGKNGELATRFANLVKVLEGSVKLVAESKEAIEEKMECLSAIAHAFIPTTWSLNKYMNNLTVGSGSSTTKVLSVSDRQSVCKNGVVALYNLGDIIQKNFSVNKEAMDLAVESWKEGVTLQQRWYALKFEGKTAEEYTAKIQKIDPTYVMPPKKKGCICGNSTQKYGG